MAMQPLQVSKVQQMGHVPRPIVSDSNNYYTPLGLHVDISFPAIKRGTLITRRLLIFKASWTAKEDVIKTFILFMRNAANDLVEIINKNRTSNNTPKLSVSPGLGCIALQYAEACNGICSSSNTITCQPRLDDFTEVFAPNCGVELPTFGPISGYILGCQQKYLEPPEAFSHVIVFQDQKTLSLLRNKTFTEVGVGIIGSHKHKGPYIWCVMFTNSQKNTTFVLEDLGRGIVQRRGCYSGTSLPCSAGHQNAAVLLTLLLLLIHSLKFFHLVLN